MIKSKKKNNIIDFPSKLSHIEKEIEAIIFAAAANIITTTYFLLFFKNSESTTPTLANKLKTTGS